MKPTTNCLNTNTRPVSISYRLCLWAITGFLSHTRKCVTHRPWMDVFLHCYCQTIPCDIPPISSNPFTDKNQVLTDSSPKRESKLCVTPWNDSGMILSWIHDFSHWISLWAKERAPIVTSTDDVGKSLSPIVFGRHKLGWVLDKKKLQDGIVSLLVLRR